MSEGEERVRESVLLDAACLDNVHAHFWMYLTNKHTVEFLLALIKNSVFFRYL